MSDSLTFESASKVTNDKPPAYAGGSDIAPTNMVSVFVWNYVKLRSDSTSERKLKSAKFNFSFEKFTR